VGHPVTGFRVYHPGALASVMPRNLEGAVCQGVQRLGKRIALDLPGVGFAVIHLMIAGRFIWRPNETALPPITSRNLVFAMGFDNGVLSVQEFSKKRRARIGFVGSIADLAATKRRGLDVFNASPHDFSVVVKRANRTLKRLLTDPDAFDGIGNAYSDEILWRARLSPVKLTHSLNDEEIERLHRACIDELGDWSDRLLKEIPGFPAPSQVTAFRPEFHVHGKFGKPCDACGNPVQRIVYAENETNYCAKCQNEGRLLADRSLSRLLKDDWPKTLEEMLGD